MDLNSIAVFVKIVEAGSLSAAASLLKMPKTTVSKRLADLEEALGIALIQRTTRRLHLTEAGSRYLAHCQAAMQELEAGRAELTSASARPRGLLRITAPVDIGHTFLPHIVRAYLKKFPDVRVELLISNRVVDLVGEGIDLAIRAGSLKDSSLVARRYMELNANLWASPRYLRQFKNLSSPADLAQLEFIVFGDTKAIELMNGRSTVKVPVTGRIKSDDLETIKSLVALGTGVGWLPDFLAQHHDKPGTLVPVLPGWRARPAGQAYFLYPKQKHASPNIRSFIETALTETAFSSGPG